MVKESDVFLRTQPRREEKSDRVVELGEPECRLSLRPVCDSTTTNQECSV